jgi:hypothetical protein
LANNIISLKTAADAIREETLPAIERVYAEEGPASILALTIMLADIWLASGFTTEDWREIIAIYDAVRELRPEAS